eukprot:CAMPEP_0169248260 /NCGR_PEP_ID=MMETSP1016-20121227/35747_1 /TAXON_ID=342587 /ORGANISM="Karlodinium micrum, Strain CCMP2283" /LENGTH=390 /DNA_ID=CAMNT_0009329043 /DNA_START=41 /DNA_END=1210 /DNA_ORIENTATION=-
MHLGFRLPDGEECELLFTRLPLGLEFKKGSPFTIECVQPGSHAEAMGVQCEWITISCNGETLEGKEVREGLQLVKLASMSLPQLRTLVEDTQCFRSTLLDIVENSALGVADQLVGPQGSSVLSEAESNSAVQSLVYSCRHNAGLFNCLLMFLRFAERAEVEGFQHIFYDGSCLPLYGNVSALFPELPRANSLPVNMAKQYAKKFAGGGSFADCRGVYERRGGLTDEDVGHGRALAKRHLTLAPSVEACLQDAASTYGLQDAVGVHVRRTDKGREAPLNLAITVAEVVKAISVELQTLLLEKVYLASDDAAFAADVQASLEKEGVHVITWGSHMSAKVGKPSHYDRDIPGLEKATDAIADCYLLGKCRKLLSTYSSLSVIAALWAAPGTPW